MWGKSMPHRLLDQRKVRLDTYVEIETDKALRELARKKEVNLSVIVNRALKEYLERHKEELEK